MISNERIVGGLPDLNAMVAQAETTDAPVETEDRESRRRRSRRDRNREPEPVQLTAEQEEAIRNLLIQLQDKDPAVRAKAAQGAAPLGAMAIPSLQPLLQHGDLKVRRAATDALANIVHHAARPGADREAEAVTGQLLAWVTSGTSLHSQIAAIRQLQYVGGDRAVPVLARVLLVEHPQMRQEALLSLERIPGRAATRALEQARRNKRIAEEFRPEIEQALQRRRETMKTVGIKERR
ncbi:MAG: HEAT repeat domain-containing protein [Armatimonadetes bacterium]|nr:HEAT repeat domain-containing protein [Armatimonadota bacterium]